MGRQEQPLAGPQFAVLRLAVDAQTRGARDKQHELIAGLIAPFASARRLTRGDEPLDTNTRALDKRIKEFLGSRFRGETFAQRP